MVLTNQDWTFQKKRPLEVLKQVEAKNLSSSSASLKKLRPGAVLTSTQFCALEKLETNITGHADMFVSHVHGTESKLALPLVPVF